jgi:hypothetical protein
MKYLVLLCALLSTTSCATNAQSPPDSVTPPRVGTTSAPLPDDYFAPAQECWKEWGALVDQWVKGGGGIKESILETRKQLAADEHSPFARLVSETWKRQSTARFEGVDGQALPWPVSDTSWNDMSSASLELTLAAVSKSCGSLAWLGPTLWDQVRIAKSHLPREMPDGIRADPHDAGNWMVYWMLVR